VATPLLYSIKSKRVRELKTLIYQGFQHTWVWNPY